MNSQQAQEVLQLHRPGLLADPELAEAFKQLKQDPALHDWFSRQQAFHARMQKALRQPAPPADLKARILIGHVGPQRMSWWRRPEILAIAATVVLLLALAAVWFAPHAGGRAADYRARMAKTALRQYSMDLVTNNLDSIRGFLSQHGSPVDDGLNPKLSQLPILGCAVLKWENQPVSMVCFGSGKKGLVWLFVVNEKALPGKSGERPEFRQVGKLATYLWNRQGKTYLLGTIGDPEQLQRYL